MKSGGIKSFKKNVIGFWLFSCGMIGCQMPMWVMADTYMEGVKQQMGEQYALALAKYMPKSNNILFKTLWKKAKWQ